MSIAPSKDQISHYVVLIKRFKLAFFIGPVILVYVFIVFRGSQLSSATASQASIASQSKNLSYPQINPTTISSINQLQDNSVNVQSLFNQARQNPFQE
jgi:hypothetical protein